MLKHLFATAQIFAFLNLLFVPAIAVFVGLAFVSGDPDVVGFWSIPVFIANAAFVFLDPWRRRLWARVVRIAGARASASPVRPS